MLLSLSSVSSGPHGFLAASLDRQFRGSVPCPPLQTVMATPYRAVLSGKPAGARRGQPARISAWCLDSSAEVGFSGVLASVSLSAGRGSSQTAVERAG